MNNKAITPPSTCTAWRPAITYRNWPPPEPLRVIPELQIYRNPTHCNRMKTIPRTAVVVSRLRYRNISLSLKALNAICTVRLLTSMTVVEYQKALGIENVVQPGWSLFTT